MKMGYNVFITGPAGSGKTYVLNEYIKFLKKNNIEVGITASTGIAATHMGGTTIHSWSGLGIRDQLTEFDLDHLSEQRYLWKRLEKVSVLIIDEVSMLHHFRFDLIEKILQHFRHTDAPFGGVQVILCGDFFQLPPVSRFGEPRPEFIYRSEAWSKLNLKICYLEEQHRQTDNDYLTLLNAIRAGEVTPEIAEPLQARFHQEPKVCLAPTKLHTHNIDVDVINDKELEHLEAPARVFEMTTRGRQPLVEVLKKSCLAPAILRLKVGARVMFVKNNFEKGYANGTLGVISGFDFEGPRVRTKDGKEISVELATWVIEEDGKIKAELSQFPLRLAWAITIHKCQGMSLDAVEVDLSKSFEKGMGYVALSRVRTLGGLKLLGLNNIALQVNEEVLEQDKQFRDLSAEQAKILHSIETEKIKIMQAEFLKRNSLSFKEKKAKKPSTIEETKSLVLAGKDLEEIIKERGLKKSTVFDHLEKIKENDKTIDFKVFKKSLAPAKFKEIEQAFKKLATENPTRLLSPIRESLGHKYSYDDLRLVRLFLD